VSHEQIWAPWRLSYLLEPTPETAQNPSALAFLAGADPSCFLCQGVVDAANPDRHVIDRDEHTVTVLNRYPYNNGHLLVAPQRHCARLDELTVAEQTSLLQTIARMIGLLEKVLKPQGFNVGLNLGTAGGAGLPAHLHWHVVPRWNGDTNFMLSVASVKVIPQALDELRGALVRTLHASGEPETLRGCPREA
jgi:ATP adenylyltransferase